MEINKEQAFELVVKACSILDKLTIADAMKLKEALEVIGKELFSPNVGEAKSEDKV